MLSPYVTYDELRAVFPGFAWVWDSVAPPVVNQAIKAGLFAVYNDLRRKGVDDTRIYIPLMFDSDNPGETHTRIAPYTSAGVRANSERRFVVNVSDGAGELSLTGIVYDGSTEIWADIHGLLSDTSVVTVDGPGLYSVLFFQRHPEYRYTVVPDGSITYSAYLVDDAVDELIYTGAMVKLLEGRAMQDEAVGNAYKEMVRNYENALSRLVADYLDAGEVVENGIGVNSVRVSR